MKYRLYTNKEKAGFSLPSDLARAVRTRAAEAVISDSEVVATLLCPLMGIELGWEPHPSLVPGRPRRRAVPAGR